MGLTDGRPISQILARKVESFSDEEIRGFWYDWFCKDASLPNKGRRLFQRLRTIAPSPRFDAEKTYVFFKNNCPAYGSLYDDFRICDLTSEGVLYCVVPAEGYENTKGRAVVWGKNPNNGEFGPLVVGTWADVKEFFHADDARAAQIAAECSRVELIREAEWHNKQFDAEAAAKKREEDYIQRQADRDHCARLDHLINR